MGVPTYGRQRSPCVAIGVSRPHVRAKPPPPRSVSYAHSWRRPARGARDRCIVLLGFALAARRSELVSIDIDDVLERPEGLLVRIARHKTGERVYEVAIPRAAREPEMCAVRAYTDLRRALAARDRDGRCSGASHALTRSSRARQRADSSPHRHPAGRRS